MKSTTAILTCLLCLSIGFSVGQVVDQPAGAKPQASRAQPVNDAGARRRLNSIFQAQVLTAREVTDISNVLGDQPQENKTIRELLHAICKQGVPYPSLC